MTTKSWLRLLLVSGLLTCLTSVADALPTPSDHEVSWATYAEPNYTGFYLYWATEAPLPRSYVDNRRVDLKKPTGTSVTVLTVLPSVSERVCFKMTAYRVIGTTTMESEFSNEACGTFVNLLAPSGLAVGP